MNFGSALEQVHRRAPLVDCITNFVTAVAAAYWAHSPVVVITPESGTMTMGLGGFQETDQLPIFSKITKFQAHVNNPRRMAELTGRAFDRAMLEGLGPVMGAELNVGFGSGSRCRAVGAASGGVGRALPKGPLKLC